MKLNPAIRIFEKALAGLFTFFFFLADPISLLAQEKLKSGPMLGFIEPIVAGVWVQTTEEAEVSLWFSSVLDSNKTTPRQAGPIRTRNEDHLVASFILKDLKPNNSYSLWYQIGDSIFKPNIEFRTPKAEGDPSEFSFAFGSCSDFDTELTEEERNGTIFEAIKDQDPDLMLWLGDNIYFKEEDFKSRDNMFSRYDVARSRPYMKELLQNVHHYAIWDDHDFGPNNSNSSYKFKNLSLEAFQHNWVHNNYVFPDSAITHRFSYQDVDFFMMDNRSFRIVNEEDPGRNQIWGQLQLDWLKSSLKTSKATFKIICTGGQFLSDAAVFENHANDAPDEREEFLDFLSKAGIGGVVFLTGDRHSTEFTAMPLDQKRTLFDWTVSPFMAKTYDHSGEPNSYRIPGSMFAEHMFGMVFVRGEKGKRKLELRAYNRKGTLVWAHDILEEMLY